jgi:hypothetical protein
MVHGVDIEQLHVLKTVRLFVLSSSRAHALLRKAGEMHAQTLRTRAPSGLDMTRGPGVENHDVLEAAILRVLLFVPRAHALCGKPEKCMPEHFEHALHPFCPPGIGAVFSTTPNLA